MSLFELLVMKARPLHVKEGELPAGFEDLFRRGRGRSELEFVLPPQPEDRAIARTIQRYFTDRVFDRKQGSKNPVDVYKPSWKGSLSSTQGLSEETTSNLTLKRIQEEVKTSYQHVEAEHKIGNSGLSFDMFNPHTGAAIEICLGAITKEFHKDVLKALLDQATHTLLFFFREYGYGSQGNVLGRKWFSQPAQRELISLILIHKVSVIPLPLVI